MYDPYANLSAATPNTPTATAERPRAHAPMPQRFPQRSYPAGAVPRYRPVDRGTNAVGTAGLVFALLATVLCWVPIVGVLCGLFGAVFGACGIAHGRKSGIATGPATAGLVVGLVALVPAVIILVAVASA